MNESEIESRMRKLRPAPPSRDLEERIGRELPGVVRAPVRGSCPPGLVMQWLDRLMWSGLGAAAAALVMVLLKPHDEHVVSRSAVPLDASSLQPVLASEEDLGWRDEGVEFDAHGQPMLKMRRMAVERQAWADLKNAGVVQVEKPRQEVLWVPVTLH